MARRAITETRSQERRRRLAYRLDRFQLPAWIERALCIVVGLGHTPIHYYSVRCAWCDAEMPEWAPDTWPRDWPPR